MPDPVIDVTTQPVLPQIKSTVINAAVIFFVALCLGEALASVDGGLHHWSDFVKGAEHGAAIGAAMMFAWIFQRSPLGVRFRALMSSVQVSDGVRKEMSLSLEQPAEGGKTTATLNPATQSVTIEKEAPPTPAPALDATPKEKP